MFHLYALSMELIFRRIRKEVFFFFLVMRKSYYPDNTDSIYPVKRMPELFVQPLV